MDDKSYFHIPKKWVRTGLVVGVTALIVAPLAAVASHSFDDVPNTNTFHDDIAWLADAGITEGCNPPENTEFCPDEAVTRGQMAAFMRRFAEYLGAEDGTPAEADHAVSASSADKASSADSAATLMGSTKDELAPRAVFDFVENAPAGENLTLSADITAPEAGVLLMTGTVDALDGPDIWYFCELEIDHGLVPGSQMASELDDTGGNGEEDCTTSGAATVAAGTHTIDFEVFDVASGVDFIAASMWALWVPFDGSGSTPSSLTDLANSSGSPAEGR